MQKRYHELKAIRHSRSSSPVTITDLPMVSSPPASPTRSETPNLATPIDLKSRSETSTPNLATSIDLKSRSTKSGTSTLNAVTPIDLKSSSTRSEASTPNLATPIDLKYSPMRAEINNDNTLSGLMARKKHLQKRLTIYQNSFLEQNGRVVETAADRLPCQADYDEYKQVKKQIAKLEGQEG